MHTYRNSYCIIVITLSFVMCFNYCANVWQLVAGEHAANTYAQKLSQWLPYKADLVTSLVYGYNCVSVQFAYRTLSNVQ